MATRLDRLDLNLLVVLNALLEERNVTRAGERLFIGQPAASSALRRLREHFKDELLVPVGRRLEPTPLALSLAGPLRDCLSQMRSVLALQPSFDPASASRRFVVCASDYAVTVLLAAAIRRVARRAPGISIELRRLPPDVEETFERSKIDLLMLPERYAITMSHPSREILRDQHVCIAWEGNSIGASELDTQRYLDSGHVIVRLGGERSIAFEEFYLPRYGRQRRVECVVDYFSALPLLLTGTDRIATVYSKLAQAMVRLYPLKVLPVPFPLQDLVEYLVWPRHLDQDPAHSWLREQVLAAALEEDAP